MFDARRRRATPASSIGGVYDALIAAQPGAVRGFVCDAAFWDVGTPADYWRTSLAFAAADGRPTASVGRGARIDPIGARRRGRFCGTMSRSAPARVLDECIVTDGVRVPAGATYRRAILVRGADGDDSTRRR